MEQGSRLVSARAVLGFRDPAWQLPVGAAGWCRCLIEWTVAPRPVDAGVPLAVAEALSEALVTQGRVTFAVGIAEPWGSGLVPRRWREGVHYRVVTTRDATATLELFDAALFNWTLQAQAAYVTPADKPSPAFTVEQFSVQDDEALARLASWPVLAILFPGVDGDVAGLYAKSESARAILLDAIGAGVQSRGGEWIVVSEEGPRPTSEGA